MFYVPDAPASYTHREVGRGLVDKAESLPQLLAWGGQDRNTVYVFDLTHEGKTAEMLRQRGCLVVGGGVLPDRLECDRMFGEKLAEACGLNVPETKHFSTITETINYIKEHPQDWYFKLDADISISSTAHGEPDKIIPRLHALRKRYKDQLSNILQECKEGIDVSTAAWWTGMDWIGPFEGTVEKKKLMDGEIGPSTGCSGNVVWFYKDYPKIARELCFDAIGEAFRRLKAPPGIYDVNSIISREDKLPYFLEWTPRFGYDADSLAQRGLTSELGEFYYNIATGRATSFPVDVDSAQMSVRVCVPPYPWEQVHELPSEKRDKASGAIGVRVEKIDHEDLSQLYAGKGNQFLAYGLGVEGGNLIVTEPSGIVGIVCADGDDCVRMNEDILDFIEDEIDIADLMHRTDMGEALSKHLGEVRSLGYETGVAC
jgi:phosphoribosylamine-glycine ligase